MTNLTAKDVLSGTNVLVWLEGEELGTWTELTVTVTINYEDVQIGFDVDRKAVSWQGDGTLNHQATNSITTKLFNKMKANKDVRFTIEGEMTKETTGETQFMTLNDCTFDALPLSAWSKGELVNYELNFRYSPSKSIINNIID